MTSELSVSIPQYHVIACPTCGIRAFTLTPEGYRRCRDGHVHDHGPRGSETIGSRLSMSFLAQPEKAPSTYAEPATGAYCSQHARWPLVYKLASDGQRYAWCRYGRHWS